MRPTPLLLLLFAFTHAAAQFTPILRKSAAGPPSGRAFSDCFALLPDSNARCSLTIYVEKALNPLAGHAFLSLSKSNGYDSVVQFIGFYHLNSREALFSDQPVPAEIADDAYHAYQASCQIQINPVQLNTILKAFRLLKEVRYQTFHFNSVDFVLQIVNCVRSTPIVLPKNRSSCKNLKIS